MSRSGVLSSNPTLLGSPEAVLSSARATLVWSSSHSALEKDSSAYTAGNAVSQETREIHKSFLYVLSQREDIILLELLGLLDQNCIVLNKEQRFSLFLQN